MPRVGKRKRDQQRLDALQGNNSAEALKMKHTQRGIQLIINKSINWISEIPDLPFIVKLFSYSWVGFVFYIFINITLELFIDEALFALNPRPAEVGVLLSFPFLVLGFYYLYFNLSMPFWRTSTAGYQATELSMEVDFEPVLLYRCAAELTYQFSIKNKNYISTIRKEFPFEADTYNYQLFQTKLKKAEEERFEFCEEAKQKGTITIYFNPLDPHQNAVDRSRAVKKMIWLYIGLGILLCGIVADIYNW